MPPAAAPTSAFDHIPRTHFEVLDRYHAEYNKQIASGEYVPMTVNMLFYGFILALAFLLIPPTSSFHNIYTRVAAFLSLVWLQRWVIVNCRAMNVSTSFGVGIISSYAAVHFGAMVLCNDAKKDFRMLVKSSKTVSGDVSSTTYRWKVYPNWPFIDRLDWVTEGLFNFRGIDWTWKIGGLPSYPAHVLKSLDPQAFAEGKTKDIPVSRNGIRRFDDVRKLLWHNVWIICRGAILMDILFCIFHRDPYFWGYADAPTPLYLRGLLLDSWILTRVYRGTAAMLLVWVGLRNVYAIAPLFYVGASHLLEVKFPRIRAWLNVRMEPWLYPDNFGSYMNVFDRGLAGWWGGWWHQIFRFTFQEYGKTTCRLLRLDTKQSSGRFMALQTAFAVSGLLHACGIHTMMGKSNPWTGCFLFFCLQSIGLTLEDVVSSWARRSGLRQRCPLIIWRAWNFLWVHTWFFFTASLFVEDFARGGLLMVEAIPVSPCRMLGLGGPDDHWWTIGRYPLFGWYSDPKGRWWLSGVTI